jgi:putative sigma-54 modulation protein
MAVIIQSPHQHISGKIKQIVQAKLERLEKLYHRIEQYHIVLKKEKNDKQENYLVEARLSIPGNDLFASEYVESFAVAAEKVSHDLEKQIRKRKTKLSRKTAGRLT